MEKANEKVEDVKPLVLDVLRIVELSSVSSPSTSIIGSEIEGERPEDEVVVDQDVWERITNLLPGALERFHDVRLVVRRLSPKTPRNG